LAPRTAGSAGSAWPTPLTANRTSDKAKHWRPTSGPSRGGPSHGLEDVARTWPTVTASPIGDYTLDRGRRDRERLTIQGEAKALTERAWPTPMMLEPQKDLHRFMEKRSRPRSERGGGHGPNLATAAEMWATPISRDGKFTRAGAAAGKNSRPLSEQAGMWATPNTVDAKGGTRRTGSGKTQRQLCHEAASFPHRPGPTTPPDGTPTPGPLVLSPWFVEALRGFPIGWSEYDCSAMPSCPCRRARRSAG